MRKPDVSTMTEQEVANLFITTLNEFVDKFNKEVTQKCPIQCRGIDARWVANDPTEPTSFYMDYSCIYKYGYTKENAKRALDLFKEYASILTLYCDVLKFQYPAIRYVIDKTPVSSARIGKELIVENLPFELPYTYYTTEDIDSEDFE